MNADRPSREMTLVTREIAICSQQLAFVTAPDARNSARPSLANSRPRPRGLKIESPQSRKIAWYRFSGDAGGTKRRRQAGNVRLPRLHAHQREEWIRAIHGVAHN